MIYTKVKVADGVELKIDLDPEDLYTLCPVCGDEFQLEQELVKGLNEDWTSRITCGDPECAILYR